MRFLLRKSQYNEIRQKYRTGIQNHIEDLKAQGFEQIIVVNGYPKSGNSWLCRIVASYLDCAIEGYIGGPDDIEISAKKASGNEKVAIFKSHHVPAELLDLDKDFVKILHIVRDPRDVAVSAAAYFSGGLYKNKILRPLAFMQAAGSIAKNQPDYPTWWSTGWGGYYAPVLMNQGHVVRYESLLEHETGALEQFFEYAQGDVDKEKLKTALEENTFASMKLAQDEMAKNHLRSGKSGGYKDELPSFLTDLIKRKTEPVFSYFKYE